ncbi:hypothetical protein RZS08_52165, partial [Arthrospira platensis SPKY1]|nr:hypothetical protein [Arthrospira platensis SPKY1]
MELAREIRILGVELERLRREYEEAITRKVVAISPLDLSPVVFAKQDLERLNEEILEAINNGRTEKVDALILERELIQRELIRLSNLLRDPEVVTLALEQNARDIVDAIRR